MSHIVELAAQSRNLLGKAASRRLRKSSKLVPAVIYGGGAEPMPIALEDRILRKAMESESFYSSILTLNVGGNTQKVVLKSLARAPFGPVVMHADFMRISETEVIRMHVPLHFVGADVAPGVRLEGGIVSHHIVSVEVLCLPSALPEYIEVDLSTLGVDESIHLSNLTLPNGVEIAHLHQDGHDLPVASVHLPRAALIEDDAPVSAEVPATQVASDSELAASKAASGDKK